MKKNMNALCLGLGVLLSAGAACADVQSNCISTIDNTSNYAGIDTHVRQNDNVACVWLKTPQAIKIQDGLIVKRDGSPLDVDQSGKPVYDKEISSGYVMKMHFRVGPKRDQNNNPIKDADGNVVYPTKIVGRCLHTNSPFNGGYYNYVYDVNTGNDKNSFASAKSKSIDYSKDINKPNEFTFTAKVGSSNNLILSDNPPPGTFEGDLFFELGRTYSYFVDGDAMNCAIQAVYDADENQDYPALDAVPTFKIKSVAPATVVSDEAASSNTEPTN